jgi:D-alanyl-lipoteichoic acid acyltransferase DltB (MBOAT superfamily)
MLFGTAQFALFLAALLLLLRFLPRRAWNATLLAASLLFYTLWIPAYLLLLLVDIGVNYLLLKRLLAAAPGSPARRRYLIASVVFTLGLLVYFKYAVFGVENLLPVLAALGLEDVALPDILLPLGISFYSFQIISLAADAYGAETPADAPPVGSLARYTLFISFFPQLIAGPILRGSELLPQLERGPDPSSERRRRGIWLLASGLVKKIVLADFLLAPFVDSVFGSAGAGNRAFHWIAAYAFAFQIYFDFSGYTDMARGISCWIGYELPENFQEPYLSRSPREFWQRWHMTLSRWLRLYLFVPLSRLLIRRLGPRWEAAATPIGLLTTMTLCGLWHGAGWNFVLWGALHGLFLSVWRFPIGRDAGPIGWRDIPAILVVFHAVVIALVFFRLPDLDQVGRFLLRLAVDVPLPGWPVFETAVVVLCAGLHVAERAWRVRGDAFARALADLEWGRYAEALALGILAGAVVLTAAAGGEFIYFQF